MKKLWEAIKSFFTCPEGDPEKLEQLVQGLRRAMEERKCSG